MAKDDLAARRAELYEAYDEAALRILLDRYGDRQAERLLREEARETVGPRDRAPEGLDLAMARTLADCARKKVRERRGKQALRLGARAAVVLLALGSVLFLSFPIHASQETPPAYEETAVPRTEEPSATEEAIEENGESVTNETERKAD